MDYKKFIEKNKDLQVKCLQELVSIKSVLENPVTTADGEVYPFGKGIQDAFAYTLNLGKELGFETKNIDNYGGHIDFGSGDEIVGIIGHLDVVAEGDKWSFEPYGGAYQDGYIYGRGTLDDKGPVLSALFAMKALKDAGYEPAKKVRLILGLDEETEWKGIKHYLEKETMPDFGFTPDADFPAIHGEKGIVNFEIAKKLGKSLSGKGLTLTSLKGGNASNMVAEKARAVVKAEERSVYEQIKEKAVDFRERTGYKLNTKGVGKSLEITAEGVSAHGASPEDGLNAISIIISFLGELNFVCDDLNVFFDFYNRYIGFDVSGEKIGCSLEDEFGRLTFNVGLAEADKEAVTLTVNARYPVTCSSDMVYDGIMPIINKYDMGILKLSDKSPVFMAEDSPMIKTFVDVYRENTGDTESKPQVIGGGTYARAMKNIVAFGALYPGDEDLMHQKDERISVERLMTTTKIYADAIYKLTQKDFKITEE